MQKNDEIILDIIDVTNEGSGVGKSDGMAVFVPLTAVGDKANVKILKVKKNYAFGKALEIIAPSPDRIIPDCPVFNQCGGCVYRHISYEAELKLKSNKVYEVIKRIGGVDLAPMPILYGEDIDRYRNKAQFPICLSGKAGFYAFHSHRIVPCGDCKLQPLEFGEIVEICEKWIAKNRISIYNEDNSKGLLRHIYIRKAEQTGEIMLTLVINGNDLPFEDKLITELKNTLGENLKSLQININKQNTNVILGDKCKTLYGESYITDILCDVKVRLSALSFYQVNRTMAEKLYKKASEYAEPKNKNILDLYCGAGTIGLSMARQAKSVIGVEIIPEAVKDAEYNARLNGIENARFICADAAKAAEELAKENIKTDVVIVDPPRKGCSAELIDTIANKFTPERVVYVSCDPATLARDIKIFGEMGYELVEYTPCDLFPRTSHIETVVCLSRKKVDECRNETEMISDEKSRYKSWSNLKKQMNDLLCDSLKDKISYFYTSYHEVHNAYGRATINYNKKELVAFSWVEMYAQEREVSQLYYEGKKVSYGELEKEKWMPECKLCDADFINSLTIYLKTDITTSLNSDNYLLRVFAYMDRRVGKRTLIKIKDEVEKLPEWVKQFYQIRCKADGIVFPSKRITV